MTQKDFGMVSIIMPSFNASSFIAESIDSILHQTYTNWELLITDDCSTDNTQEIVETYVAKDRRIKYFRFTENQGAGAARNHAIEQAKGRFIAFCDSDDCWKPEKLAHQLKFMAEHRVGVCFSSYIKCDEAGEELGMVVAYRKITYADIVRNDYIGFLTLIYDTAEIGKIYMPVLRKRQDWAMKILLLQKIPVAYGLLEPLAYYRIRTDSLSRNKKRLVKYNVQVYSSVLHYNVIRAWCMFLFVFMPHYFAKALRLKIINR